MSEPTPEGYVGAEALASQVKRLADGMSDESLKRDLAALKFSEREWKDRARDMERERDAVAVERDTAKSDVSQAVSEWTKSADLLRRAEAVVEAARAVDRRLADPPNQKVADLRAALRIYDGEA